MLGRSFNGSGKVIDSFSKVLPEASFGINLMPSNPSSHNYHKAMIQTGMSAIGTMSSTVCGQKTPLFFVTPPHNEMATQVAR